MKLIDFENFITDKTELIEYLQKIGILKEFVECPECCSNKLGLKNNYTKFRCYSCKYEWSVKKGSVLFNSRLTLTQFIMMIKLYSHNIIMPSLLKEIGINFKSMKISLSRLDRTLVGWEIPPVENVNDIIIYVTVNNKIEIVYTEDLAGIDEETPYMILKIKRTRGINSQIEHRITILEENLRSSSSLLNRSLLNFIPYLEKQLLDFHSHDDEELYYKLEIIKIRFNYSVKDFENLVVKMLSSTSNTHELLGF